MGHAYDKSKWHYDTISEFGLPLIFASHHIAYFMKWLIENNLMSEDFNQFSASKLSEFKKGSISALDLYISEGECLVDDMISDRGNEFALFYYEGRTYSEDYARTLQNGLDSEYRIPFTDENYSTLKVVIDRRFADWERRQSNVMWKIQTKINEFWLHIRDRLRLSGSKVESSVIPIIQKPKVLDSALATLKSDIKAALGPELSKVSKVDLFESDDSLICEVQIEKAFFGSLCTDTEKLKSIREKISNVIEKKPVVEVLEN